MNDELIEKEWNKFWWLNKDRLADNEDGLSNLDPSVNSKISFSVGFNKALKLKEEEKGASLTRTKEKVV